MERASLNAPIYKITIGDALNGLQFREGQKVKAGESYANITRIERNENNYFILGAVVYIIYAKEDKEGAREFVWMYFENQPVKVVCRAPGITMQDAED